MNELHCFICLKDSTGFANDIEVTLHNFQALISDLRCNYEVISHHLEDYSYFYLFLGCECIYIGCCSSWLDIK